MIRLYSVSFSDGSADMVDPINPCPVADLGELDASDLSTLQALAVGESLMLGGGAAPLVSIARTL